MRNALPLPVRAPLRRTNHPPENLADLCKTGPEVCSVISGLQAAMVAVPVLLPLVVVPGVDRPFSTPKFFLLAAVVGVGTLLATGYADAHFTL